MMGYEKWFELFTAEVRRLGYAGPIDRDAFEWEFEEGNTPEDSAKSFVDEMND